MTAVESVVYSSVPDVGEIAPSRAPKSPTLYGLILSLAAILTLA